MTGARFASIVTLLFVTGVSGSARASSPASAPSQSSTAPAAAATLHGTVADEQGRPVAGALVSVTGDANAVALTDGAGRFVFEGLSPGPYLVRVHRRGFVPARAALVQAVRGRTDVPLIRLTDPGTTRLLAAGVAGDAGQGDAGRDEPDSARVADPADESDHDHEARAWRLRHARRGALDDVTVAARPAAGSESRDARTSWLPVLPFSGEFNLLTSASFDRPQDLFLNRLAPAGLAYLALESPAPGGEWHMHGTLMQGDLSAWMASGGYSRAASAAHAYEAGGSFARQRYDGGNAAALAAIGDGGRVAGSLYGYDHWRLGPAVVTYGGRYDRYDYLHDRGLLSPSASISIKAGGGLRLHGSASQARRAPGAEEFTVAETFGLGVTPVRTFSSLAADGGFTPEDIRMFEAGVDQSIAGLFTIGGRVFTQRVDDQMVAVFGVDRPGRALSRTGHYFVGGAGDYAANGVGVSLRREIGAYVTGAVEYSNTAVTWTAPGADRPAIGSVAAMALRAVRDRVNDVRTSVNAEIPQTSTRIIVVYRMLQASATDDAVTPLSATRFDVQVHQTLPFLRFTNAQWAALIAVQNQARDAQFDQSVYDELLAVQVPTRLMGGLTVRF
ncbi:MAG: TonB-dependent receptor [Vicinamibacterales bacterium]